MNDTTGRRSARVSVMAMGTILGACFPPHAASTATGGAESASASTRLSVPELLRCLGAPANTLYEPQELDAAPAPGLSVHTFEQETSSCGPAVRRYVSYVPAALGPKATVPVVLVLHGQGASAESMMTFQTHGTFNALADRVGLVVAYGNGLPTNANYAGLPNSGAWRSEYTRFAGTVDELAYLERLVRDLADRGVIAGTNAVYLVGQSNGGGMALSAGLRQPNAYTGVAAFMPYAGSSPAAPQSLAGSRLRHVLFAYSLADPGLPTGYAARVLSPLADGWARALGFSEAEIASPAAIQLQDSVDEEQGTADDAAAVQDTRDSTVQEVDLKSANGAFRRLVFDHAGHFWPTRKAHDPQQAVDRYGLRNQDIEAADQTWSFFGE